MLKEDIRKVKDQGKLFERLSADYDIGNVSYATSRIDLDPLFAALQRNADVSKSKRK